MSNVDERIERLKVVDNRDRDIVQRALEKESIRSIGRRYGISHQRVAEILAREQITISASTLVAPKTAEMVQLRLPDGVRAKIIALANENGRSMNTEIVCAIERHLASSRSVLERLDRIEQQLGIKSDD